MVEIMTKSGFLAALEVERARWEELIEQISPAWMLTPVTGAWTVKDILAHISWYEKEMVQMLHTRLFSGSELWDLPQDERNRAIYRQNLSRSLDDILAETTQVYQEMTREIKKLTDEDLNDPARFPGMPAALAPWQILAGNSYRHYRDHMPEIQNWLDHF